MSTGRVNPAHRLEHQGISDLGQVHYNLLEPALIQAALTRNEGRLGNGGTLLVSTGCVCAQDARRLRGDVSMRNKFLPIFFL